MGFNQANEGLLVTMSCSEGFVVVGSMSSEQTVIHMIYMCIFMSSSLIAWRHGRICWILLSCDCSA